MSEIEQKLLELASLHADVDNVTKALDESRSLITNPDLDVEEDMSLQFQTKLEETRTSNANDPK